MSHRDLLVGDIFTNAAASVADRLAVAFQGGTMSFGQLEQRANQLARALVDRGLRPGDRVVTLIDTAVTVPALFAGAAKAGLVFAPASPGLTVDEASEMAGAARPALVVADTARREIGAAAGRSLGVPVTTFDGPDGLLATSEDFASDAYRDEGLRETDPHVLFFTSGSTGRSKGVVLSHRASVLRCHPGSQLQHRGPGVCTFPLFHMAGFTTGLNQWHARAACVYVASDPESIVGAIRSFGADRINCIPALWHRVFDHLDQQPDGSRQLPELRIADTGTSATPVDLLQRIAAIAPRATVRVFYGSTEAGNVCALAHEDIERKPGSCGVVSPLATIRLDDGELCVSGPLLMDEYFDDRAATDEALVDGWYRTGDLAEIDDEGYVTIVGRAKDVIRTGGEWVSPAQVEAVLRRHPGVADLAVVGLPDEAWGEVVTVAVVTADPARPPTLDELVALCRGQLARHKQPRRAVIVDSIPRTTATGQVRRRDLVAQLTSPGDGPPRA